MKNIQPSLYIRKYYILILFVSLFFLLLCGIWEISFFDSQHTRELSQIGNITGAVLSEYPEAETTLVSALQDTHYSHMDAGYSILQKYGYRKNLLMSDNFYYHSTFINLLSFLALIIFCDLALITVCFLRFTRAQKEQEMQLHALLDRYLAEDYSVSEPKESYGSIFNDSFTDTLSKLGNKLMAKTRALAEERDHTKTLVTDISHQLKHLSAHSKAALLCVWKPTRKRSVLTFCKDALYKWIDLKNW